MIQVAFLFPGQGAFHAGATRALSWTYPDVQRAMQAIDAVAERRLGRSLLRTLWNEAHGIDHFLREAPDLLQLAIYAASVSRFEALRARGIVPDVLMGHSFGEIAALVCGGAFSIGQGAEIVCDRIESLRAAAPPDGMMAAVAAAPEAVHGLLAACFPGLSAARPGSVRIAVENHASQTVVSGSAETVQEFISYCAGKNISAQRLNSPYAFHHVDLEKSRIEFERRLRVYKKQPINCKIYSPILNRFYADADDLAECLARHFVMPVRFRDGVMRLKSAGADVFVECGALNALSRIVVRVAGPGVVKTFPGAADAREELSGVEQIFKHLEGGRVMNDDIRASNLNLDFDEFWRNSGPGIVDKIKDELQRFFTARSLTASPAPHVPGADFASQPKAPAAPAPAPVAAEPARVPRDRLFAELVAIYAEAMEYPVEVFTESVELEAELGIDSVKQTEIIQRISARYGLPPLPANFRTGDFKAMGQIVDFVYEHQGKAVLVAG
ncbi:acyltransferase domain-containing protein [Burkholderia alba]|uniref:acyltransferase domain-containing protein n=1 Tax=Burkholderia alba TaxID=2683677 RepID=UPI002B0524DF|nr:acyltransferase domain-containing protein [Burkholderia alba]